MKIDSAIWEGGYLKLHTADVDARHFAYAFTPGEYEIRPKRSLRSLEANALFWKLCQDVAQAVGLTKNEVYKNAIREVGTYSTLVIDYAAIPEFEKIWESKGIGWFCDVADDAQEAGKKILLAYHGSSTYTVKQMSALIDNIMQDAKAVGVETLSDRERSLILDDCAKRH